MSLAIDLLTQARMLATFDPGVPSQANLRRASSAAYYALFHLLISEAVTLLVPAQPRELRSRVGRTFNHADMQKICAAILRSDSGERFGAMLVKPISMELRLVAELFIQLQVTRHTADYDTAAMFLRTDVLEDITDVEQAFTGWTLIRDSEEAAVFLTALAFGVRWSR